MAGRPPKPTHLKLVTGTAQKCRTNKREPKPERSIPSPPAHLTDKAKTTWGAVSVILDKMGVLTEADGMAMVGLCEAYADLLAARESLSRPLTMVSEGADGEKASTIIFAEAGERYYWTIGKGGPMRRARPEVADIADADRRFAAWLAKFGLTPADRTRVAGQLPGDSNPFADL
ncbi:P27 family phage terminase small subunit [Azospirillum picis]|uniref:P27 family predicted phage terminase small subunit n=1 Tax=Azospirillum picis TaxID=488438 RepID=A0ABU0MSQ3_9PROT|nr:P27 family phage terminase small subunit [Azospirillum picis]MBP2302535.1 P27 family predicted phage terminase small subunit [Azospirillum picis]MDQ0536223.1 P27 family predicted phage terminase small subunit [Azospirillum picis]